MQNAGQTCTAGSRLLVQRDIFDRFIERVAEAFAKTRAGTPEMDLHCSPPMNPAQLARVQRYIDNAREELVGPVLAAMPFDDEADAIALANATDCGLLAAVWTENGGRQQRVAKAVRAGQVFINCYGAGGGVELPFGRTKRSGHGREKGCWRSKR